MHTKNTMRDKIILNYVICMSIRKGIQLTPAKHRNINNYHNKRTNFDIQKNN